MNTADFIIIGAGAAGATLAAELSASASVILLEAEAHAGYHASGRSAAVFVPSYGHGLLRELTRMSRPSFDVPDEEFYPNELLSRRGVLRLVLEGGENQHADTIDAMPGIELLTLEDAGHLFPFKSREKFVAASFEVDAYDIDADGLLRGSLRKATKHGADIRYNERVTAARRQNGLWNVETQANSYQAPVIVKIGRAHV